MGALSRGILQVFLCFLVSTAAVAEPALTDRSIVSGVAQVSLLQPALAADGSASSVPGSVHLPTWQLPLAPNWQPGPLEGYLQIDPLEESAEPTGLLQGSMRYASDFYRATRDMGRRLLVDSVLFIAGGTRTQGRLQASGLRLDEHWTLGVGYDVPVQDSAMAEWIGAQFQRREEQGLVMRAQVRF